ncbi:hypothetical protein V6N13_019185 [Hibiscus sabdariffa]
MAPKGTCRGRSTRVGQVARAALKRNFHRAAGRILCRRLKIRDGGIVSGRVALLPRSTEIQPFVASIRPSPRIHFSFYSISVRGSTLDV